MTRPTLLDAARHYSRITDSSEPDTNVHSIIQEALYAFASDVGGFFSEDFLPLTPKFDVETNFAIRLTVTGGSNDLAATDVLISSNDLLDQVGAMIASNLQTAIVAAGASDVTVAWDSSNLDFTLTDSNATVITVAAPSSDLYVDATDLLFGKTGTQDGTWEGDFPQNCTIEVTLPTDYQSMLKVEWDGNPLKMHPFGRSMSPSGSGTPRYYAVIEERRLRIWPSPTEQKMLHIWYNEYPALLADSTLPLCIPLNYHNALAYWTAAELCARAHDTENEQRNYGKYWRMKNKYLVQKLSQNTAVTPQAPENILDYKVIV